MTHSGNNGVNVGCLVLSICIGALVLAGWFLNKTDANELPPGFVVERNSAGMYRIRNNNYSDYRRELGWGPHKKYSDAVEDAWGWHEFMKDDEARKAEGWKEVQP